MRRLALLLLLTLLTACSGAERIPPAPTTAATPTPAPTETPSPRQRRWMSG